LSNAPSALAGLHIQQTFYGRADQFPVKAIAQIAVQGVPEFGFLIPRRALIHHSISP
jgi:hypothetical protein